MPPRSSVLPSTRPRLPESLIFTKSLAVEMSLPPNSPPQVFWWKNLKSNEEALSEIPATSVSWYFLSATRARHKPPSSGLQLAAFFSVGLPTSMPPMAQMAPEPSSLSVASSVADFMASIFR